MSLLWIFGPMFTVSGVTWGAEGVRGVKVVLCPHTRTYTN